MARRSWAASGDGAVDEQVAQAAIAQRLQMADALRQRGMAGASLDNVGGQLVGNPYARALSSGLDSYRAGREQKGAEEDAMALAANKRERLTKALSGAGGVNTPDGMIEYGTRLLADPSTAEVGQFYIQSGQKAKEAAARAAAEQARWGQQDKAAEDRFNRQETTAERRHRERMEAEAARAAQGGSGRDDRYSIPIRTDQGLFWGNTRTEALTPMIPPGASGEPSKPLTASGDSVKLQGELAAAKAEQKKRAEAVAQAKVSLARYDQEMPTITKGIDRLLNHPGLSGATGFKDASSLYGALDSPISGTDEADFVALLDTMQAKEFLQGFEILRGGGSITEKEGEKATQAMINLSRAQSDEQMKQALMDLRDAFTVARAKLDAVARMGGGAEMPADSAPTQDYSGMSDEDLLRQLGGGQ